MTNEAFAKLSWILLEHRVRYYHYDRPVISDEQYDKLEQQYLKGCLELDQPNTLAKPTELVPGNGMIGLDLERPSVQNVLDKIY